MYSLILMATMASGPETASFGKRYAACYGCCGGVAVSCYGCYGSCTGCWSSCYGCYGGAGYARHHKWGGCWSSCYGSCWGSCYGSCWGSCWGSCYGSCYGVGCYGACYGSYYPYTGGCYAYPLPAGMTIISSNTDLPPIPAVPVAASTPSTNAAKLTIELPANAKLFVDGKPISGEGATRQFHTPELVAGKKFFYDFRAEIQIEGRVEIEEKRVIVKAGDVLNESFPKLIAMTKSPSEPFVSTAK